MINFIGLIRDEEALDRWQATLGNLDNGLDFSFEPVRILVLTDKPDLYLETREKTYELLEARKIEILVDCEENKDLLTYAKECLPAPEKGEFVFIWNGEAILDRDTLSDLVTDYFYNRYVGFISGDYTKSDETPYGLKDLWGEGLETVPRSEVKKKNHLRFLPVDVIKFYGLITPREYFEDFDFSVDNCELEYGKYLRRLGYSNLVDEEIEYI